MMWVGIIAAVYLFGLAIASIAIDTNDQASGRAYSYSCGFAAAILVMLVYANIHGI